MRLLVINGSFRKSGNTARVVGLVEERLRALAADRGVDVEIETVYLGHLRIGACRGCRVCFDRGEAECPLIDDAAEIKAKIGAAVGVIVASPVYVDDVSGISKVWIDRLAHVCHRPEFAGKCVYAIVTTAGSPPGHALGTLTRAWQLWGAHVVGRAAFRTGARMEREEVEVRYGADLERIARRLFEAIETKAYARPSFVSLMTFAIQRQYWRNAPEDSLDRRFWESRGWTSPGCDYYLPHSAWRLKAAAAGLVGRTIAPLVS
jgi:multimeric flavodoxin WrbA